MEVFFADDSTQKSRRDKMGLVIGLGGVLIEEQKLRLLAAKIEEIAKTFGMPTEAELKWSPKKNSWIYKNLHGDKRENCYKQILTAAAGHDAKAIVVCWNTGHGNKTNEDAFETCVDYLFERLSVHLTKRVSNHCCRQTWWGKRPRRHLSF